MLGIPQGVDGPLDSPRRSTSLRLGVGAGDVLEGLPERTSKLKPQGGPSKECQEGCIQVVYPEAYAGYRGKREYCVLKAASGFIVS